MGERCVERLSLVQRCNDALAVADLLLAYLDDDESAGRLEVALSRALWLTGRWTEAEQRSRVALERPGLSAPLRARLEALHALALSRVGSPASAQPVAERALATSGATADRTGHLFALHALAEVARNAGHHRTSLSYFRQLRTENEPAYVAQEIMALQHLDRYVHARTMLDQSWQQAGNDRAAILPSLLYAQIWPDYNLARLDETETTARTLLTLGRELGSRVCQLESASVLSAAALIRGDVEEARARMPLGGQPEPAELAHVPVLVLVRGWLAAAEGDPGFAVRQLTPLLDAALDERDPWPWKPGWLRMLTRTGLAAGDLSFARRAVHLAAEGARRNPGVVTFQAIALDLRGLVDDDPGPLAEAADVVADSPRPLIRATVFEDHGRALLRAGDVTGGADRLDQAWAVYDQVGALGARAEVQRVLRAAGIRRPWWPAARSRPAEGWAALTDAEVRVARLIGAGHTNKSAAAQLQVSANTVGTHLRSVFAKLGVSSRVQLTNALNARESA